MGLEMVLGLGIELALGLGGGWVSYITARICLNKSFALAEDSKTKNKFQAKASVKSSVFVCACVCVCVCVCVCEKNRLSAIPVALLA